jgi:hypothetical protein
MKTNEVKIKAAQYKRIAPTFLYLLLYFITGPLYTRQRQFGTSFLALQGEAESKQERFIGNTSESVPQDVRKQNSKNRVTRSAGNIRGLKWQQWNKITLLTSLQRQYRGFISRTGLPSLWNPTIPVAQCKLIL